MKTEEQVKSHAADLAQCLASDCGCAGTSHEDTCEKGRIAMEASVQTLAWVLDIDGGNNYEQWVGHLGRRMAGARGVN
jgi:hypothetical protein